MGRRGTLVEGVRRANEGDVYLGRGTQGRGERRWEASNACIIIPYRVINESTCFSNSE